MVVIAALFIAFAVIAAAAVERNTTVQQITRRDDTAALLSRLSNAIIEYGVFNATSNTLLYPCPAADNVAITNASFGASTVACSTSVSSGNTLLTGGGSTIRGMVPVQTLSSYGIGLNDAFDGWNNRIAYVVNRNLTLGSTSSAGAQSTNPTITDPVTLQTIPAPDFILISYGRDGVGATKHDSTAVGITCSSSTVWRFENCDGDDAFYNIPTYTASSAAAGTYFDDILTYYRQ